ncbi:MAG: DUF1592 domain-containing protein [Planctomycetes bacterium]|nr:DUF1592 domain-containing protein [Planctomycetota bacterium]MCH9726622.1 DUF1592 domain-containing protein [Planctomycetota bacterium]MCH9779291.1 DUF1592 domain-containing protein [Planctomycetota bacterium]MCH9789739.1 DUF1592 domain-containing protein [Planctomycetota bacterium]
MRIVTSCMLSFLITESLCAASPEPADYFEKSVRPVLVKYCADCHEPDDSKNDVKLLKARTADEISQSSKIWFSASHQLRNRTMPPADEPQPTEAERLQIANWIETYLRETACDRGPYAGRILPRRLNRTEYDNTIRDLFGLNLKFSETFPNDGAGGEGFDNNGETLFLPPILMERYLEAAQQILDGAIITPPLMKTYTASDFLPAKSLTLPEARSINPGQDISIIESIYLTNDYSVKVKLQVPQKKNAILLVKIDGIKAHRFKLSDQADQTVTTDVRLTRGLHSITLAVPKPQSKVNILSMELVEKRGTTFHEKKALHQRIFQVAGKNKPQDRDSAQAIIRHIARKAYRRSVKDQELSQLMKLYDRAAARDDPYEERIKLALKAVLVSPHFLFRTESNSAQPGMYPISDYELATRLSYFFWASTPDDELLRLADKSQLHKQSVLNQQITRMLADPKAHALSKLFTEQWLGTKDVGGRVAPVSGNFREIYSTELALDFREEAIQMMDYIFQSNRSLLEIIDADYAFLNQRLAKHYDVDGVKGRKFRKVSITDGRRGGVLGLGGVHMLTSYPKRTSPVLRGAWVLETLLGTPVPPPPPGVPALKEKSKKNTKRSIRQILEAHREHATCAACHDIIDPIGFGLENYDLFGRWREKERDQRVDATGTFPSGETFSGPAELKKILLKRKDELTRHFTTKMLGYALGRSLEDADACTIETIAKKLEQNGYRSQTLIREIVFSKPFLYRDGTATEVKLPKTK